ncbi:putative ABC transport system ATP-binding protein [Prauserella shujinwangii]|uniref:Putative ABC transport system ATP-binding protein n=1 Tax=Prauserella shujinwangii TaxID=1453103 RepID=A0A2T0LKK7_9PSEU|nr:ABC transporter ATP-binding protein [Prauserella shujinwangii]PRX43439.1 putative ABC transport system ATP-binding protein [Prauserella shujinwangii]
MPEPLLTVSGVHKSYAGSPVLRPVSFVLTPGAVTVLTGPSGSGKSTLLMIAGGWEAPDGGEVTAHPPLPGGPLGAISWRHAGFVPQSVGLLDELTIAENLAFAARLGGPDGRRRVTGLLGALDLGDLADRLPAEVSGGERQRAAVGRALAAGPSLVLADEPTSHQDSARTGLVLDALRAAADRGAAVLVASHDPAVARHADRTVTLDSAHPVHDAG